MFFRNLYSHIWFSIFVNILSSLRVCLKQLHQAYRTRLVLQVALTLHDLCLQCNVRKSCHALNNVNSFGKNIRNAVCICLSHLILLRNIGSFLWVWVSCEQRSLKTKHTNFSKRKQIVL